MLVVC